VSGLFASHRSKWLSISRLQTAMPSLEFNDNVSRDQIADAILKLANGGEFDPDKLLNYAISRFSYRNEG
jgi:hypothetical protein